MDIHKPDVVGIAETWIDTQITDFEDEYNIPSYKFFHLDRNNRRGGGVAIFINVSLNPAFYDKFEEYALTVKISDTSNKHALLSVIYRPPHRNVAQDEALYSHLTTVIRDKAAIIIGDFNCKNINWLDLTANDREGDLLLNFSKDNFLFQRVKEPTRGNNILDLVFTSDDELIHSLEIKEHIGASDHALIEFYANFFTKEHTNAIKRLDYRKANWAALKSLLRPLSLPSNDTSANWAHIKTKLHEAMKQHIPTMKMGKSFVQPKWFNNEIREKLAEKTRKYKILKSNPTDENYSLYSNARRLVNRAIRRAKINEEKRIAEISKINPKEFYAYVNSKRPSNREIGALKKDNGQMATTQKEIASVLNSYFCDVFIQEDFTNIPDPVIFYEGDNPLIDIIVTPQMIEKKIKKLSKYKTPGPDGIPARILKILSDELIDHLATIFNDSLNSGSLPLDWKIANVTPIFKKGQPDLPSNYRPISLTSTVGKLLESIITDAIVKHLETNNLFFDTQHGFRKNRSCLTNLLEFFHVIYNVFDEHKAVDLVYLDFQKAFDKVPHKRLMSKFRALGIDGSIARWVNNWLEGRKQRVVVKGEESDWKGVTSGVPQGSVLGPVLFLIYINDIDVGLTSTLAKFADDLKLGCKATTCEDAINLQCDLNNLALWTEKWLMKFNLDKCKIMHIGSKNQLHDYLFYDKVLTRSSCEKDLGIYICDDLKVSRQCLEAEKKAMKVLGFIKRTFTHKSENIVITLYKALVRPHLEYAVQFWSPYLTKDIEKLERVQARATKMIPALRRLSYERRLAKLKMFTLETRRLRGELIQAFKIIRGFDNVDAKKLFQFSNNNTRNNGFKIILPIARSQVMRNFFTYKTINKWNNLPCEVVNSPSIDAFKRRLDKILPIG